MEPKRFGNWIEVKTLDKGGQGQVYLVERPERVRERAQLATQIIDILQHAFAEGTTPGEQTNPLAGELDEALTRLRSRSPEDYCALKHFRVNGASEAETLEAVGRLIREIAALKEMEGTPGILRLIDANVDERWIVTEYQPGGTLDGILENDPQMFRRDAVGALRALRPVVAAVAELHSRQPAIVHRDIKPANIFHGSGGSLVLGDFGIVFREKDTDRLTQTFEKVGTSNWMAPWAVGARRIETVRPSFDVFPLAKVLWCMIAGERMLPYWFHREEDHNLEKKFPDQPSMRLINSLLDTCVVQREQECLPDAGILLERVDQTLEVLRRGGEVLREGATRFCRVCGKGAYRPWQDGKNRFLAVIDENELGQSVGWGGLRDRHKLMAVRPFRCEYCGHVEFFNLAHGKQPPGWSA